MLRLRGAEELLVVVVARGSDRIPAVALMQRTEDLKYQISLVIINQNSREYSLG